MGSRRSTAAERARVQHSPVIDDDDAVEQRADNDALEALSEQFPSLNLEDESSRSGPGVGAGRFWGQGMPQPSSFTNDASNDDPSLASNSSARAPPRSQRTRLIPFILTCPCGHIRRQRGLVESNEVDSRLEAVRKAGDMPVCTVACERAKEKAKADEAREERLKQLAAAFGAQLEGQSDEAKDTGMDSSLAPTSTLLKPSSIYERILFQCGCLECAAPLFGKV